MEWSKGLKWWNWFHSKCRNLDSWIVFMVSYRSWQYVWCSIQLTGDGDLILGIPPSCDSLWSYWPQLRGRGQKHLVSKSVIGCSWDIWDIFWKCLDVDMFGDIWRRCTVFGSFIAMWGSRLLKRFTWVGSHRCPERISPTAATLRRKKTWTTYHLGLRLWGFSQALAATTPVWNCSETDHPGTESCESNRKNIAGTFGRLERLILGILGIIHVRSCEAWLLVSLMNSFGANFPRYAELAAGPRNVHPRWGNLVLGRVIAPADKTWRKLILWWFDFDVVYHSRYLLLHSWERWSCFCGLSADMRYSVKFSTDHTEGCKQDEHAGECVRSSAWTAAGSVLTGGDVDGTVGSWFLSPRFFQEVQRHPSAKTHKMEIWQIMMDCLQWYVNPVDAVFFLRQDGTRSDVTQRRA